MAAAVEAPTMRGFDSVRRQPQAVNKSRCTSGQKVLLNGGLNLSILDGWWAEAYDGLNGFAIGDSTTHVLVDEQDKRDAESRYQCSRKRWFRFTTTAMSRACRAGGCTG
jgi:hypothetical protein